MERKGNPWVSFSPTENWAALVDNSGFGLGIWAPNDYTFSGGFFGTVHGIGGPADAPTGYIAPNFKDILDHNIVYKYHYVFIVGSIRQIRSWVYQQAPRAGLPQWKFTHDRRHWVYVHAHDTGWPIKGCLNVSPAGPDSRLISPSCFWQAAQAPALYLHAAFKTTEKSGMVGSRSFHHAHFSLPSRVAFLIIGDGRYHHYVNPGNRPTHRWHSCR